MSSERPAPPTTPIDDLGERAARVRAMLLRWAAEAVSDEPEWGIEDIEPMRLDSDSSQSRK